MAKSKRPNFTVTMARLKMPASQYDGKPRVEVEIDLKIGEFDSLEIGGDSFPLDHPNRWIIPSWFCAEYHPEAPKLRLAVTMLDWLESELQNLVHMAGYPEDARQCFYRVFRILGIERFMVFESVYLSLPAHMPRNGRGMEMETDAALYRLGTAMDKYSEEMKIANPGSEVA